MGWICGRRKFSTQQIGVATLDGMKCPCALVLLGLLFASLGEAASDSAPQISPQAESLLNRFCEFYQKTRSFSVKTRSVVRADGDEKQQFAAELVVGKPDKARVTFDGSKGKFETVFDGKSLVFYNEAAHQFRKMTGTFELSRLVEQNCPIFGALAAENVRGELLAGSVSIGLAGSEQIDGKQCELLEIQGHGVKATAWIESGREPLLRRFVAEGMSDKVKMEVHVDCAAWNCDPHLAEDAFVFHAPAGVTEAKQEESRATHSAPKIEVPPIAVSDHAYTARDFMRQVRAWAERVWLKPFEAQLPADKPWAAEARAFVQEAIAAWSSDSTIEDTRNSYFIQPLAEEPNGVLAKRGAALIKAGCDDPLVGFLTNHFRYCARDYPGLPKSALQVFTRLAGGTTTYPKSLAWMAGLYADMICRQCKQTKELGEVDRRIPELAIEALQAGDYSGADDALFVFYALYFQGYVDDQYDALAKVAEAPALPEWAYHTLLGWSEISHAWHDRGDDWGSNVTEDGWKGFSTHLSIARDELTAGWMLRPNRPEAAAGMIMVTMGGKGNSSDSERVWFDRAIAAQFDYMRAYHSLLWAYRPRWGGSREIMLAFADACVATNRYDTKVPRMYLYAVAGIGKDMRDMRKVLSDPAIAARCLTVAKVSAEDPRRAFEWWERTGFLVLYSYMAGDYATAGEALKKIHRRFTVAVVDAFHNEYLDVPAVLREIDACNDPSGPRYQAAERLFVEADKSDQALAAYEELAKDPSALIAKIARERIASLKLEKQLASGNWVDLPTIDWETSGGKWQSDADGSLVGEPWNQPTFAIAPPRMGASFEVRADLDFTPPKEPDDSSLCMALGFKGAQRYLVSCGFSLPRQQSEGLIYSCRSYDYDEKKMLKLPIAKKNRYWIQVWDGKITFFFNGVKVCDAYENNRAPEDWSQARIAFVTSLIRRGVVYRISNLHVRLLKEQPPAPAAAELMPAP